MMMMMKNHELYKSFKVRIAPEGKILLLEKNRINESIHFMKVENINNLEINYIFCGTKIDYSFLNTFNFITYLQIVDSWTDDISEIHKLNNLETLSIKTNCNTTIDFSVFPKLKKCILNWRSNAKSLYNCTELEHLALMHYKPTTKDFSLLKKIKNLKSLWISNSPIHNLNGIENFQKLEKLELYYLRPLESLNGVESLSKLKRFHIESCKKINTIEQLRNLKQLNKITIDKIGDIPSLEPLSKLENLEFLYNNANVIDGNISYLLHLKKLKKLLLVPKKHYSHTKKEIQQVIEKNTTSQSEN